MMTLFDFTKEDKDLKEIFKNIRNYLVANLHGTNRDELLLVQIINIIFCKIYDEQNKIYLFFFNKKNESPTELQNKIKCLFSKVKENYPNIFDKNDKLDISTNELVYIVEQLQDISLLNLQRDIIADAFEVFIGHSIKGSKGQFFTPKNVVTMMVEMISPKEDEKIIDPACGIGGFLVESYKKTKNLKNIYGIDKDCFLTKITKAYLTLVGQDYAQIYCDDSLENPNNWKNDQIKLDLFDVLLTNPPFGTKIPVKGKEKLSQYELGYKWKTKNEKLERTTLKTKEDPQTLFIERSIQLLKNKGRMAIVLPEGIFGNSSDKYIWEFLKKNGNIMAIISLSQETFQPHTHMKTSILIYEKGVEQQEEIFMAFANKVGHDKNGKIIYKINNDGTFVLDENGNKIIDDETPIIAENYKLFLNNKLENQSHLGFSVKFNDIKYNIFIPEYYNPEINKKLKILQTKNYELVSIEDLIKDGVISIKRGHEIGSQYYGMGDVPFIRTSDIVNWEVKIDPIKCVPEEIYSLYKDKQGIKENDILFVKDGTFLIGRTAFVTSLDEKIIIQSHILKFRIKTIENFINPYYFLYLINLPIVKEQIKNKTFVQGTISTIGDRINELILPINKYEINEKTNEIKDILEKKQELRKRIINLIKG